jgi:predicted GNAT superfamily acetyltransferase
VTSLLVPLSALPLDPVVALNNDHITELSHADAPRMQRLMFFMPRWVLPRLAHTHSA